MIAIHAERVADDPQAVRWVMPAGIVPSGRIRRAPGRLGELLGDATLSDALTEPTALWLRLRDGLFWSTYGSEVAAAVQNALSDPLGWEIEPAHGEVLERVTVDLLDGSVGDFVRSHSGSVQAQRDGDDVVIRLGGACEHCAAAEFTLRTRLLDALRRRLPDVTEHDSGPGQLRLRLSPP